MLAETGELGVPKLKEVHRLEKGTCGEAQDLMPTIMKLGNKSRRLQDRRSIEDG
jgi:hypothetical protein